MSRSYRRLPLLLVLAVLLGSGTSARAQVLDKQKVLDAQTFWDNRDWDWYKEHIPFFECPDTDLTTTYYYRWEVVTKHLTYGSPNTGYSFTEFIDRPFWSGAYGAISCPVGHQLYEVRWLRDPQYARDYAEYWFRTEGAQPRRYSCWLADALWANDQRVLATGSPLEVEEVLPHSGGPRTYLSHRFPLSDAEGRVTPPPFDVAGYLEAIDRCRSRFPGLGIRTGVELGEPHRHPEAVARVLADGTFERVLGSLHSLADGEHFREPDGLYPRRDPAGVVRDYLREVAELATRSDLFAVGAILFEILAGRPAFAGRTVAEVLRATVTEQPPALIGPPAVTACSYLASSSATFCSRVRMVAEARWCRSDRSESARPSSGAGTRDDGGVPVQAASSVLPGDSRLGATTVDPPAACPRGPRRRPDG